MNGRAFALSRAVRGPLLLIAVGGLFALDQAGIIAFSRTWPVLFILFGVMKLIERILAPPPPPPAPAYYQPPPTTGSYRP